MLNIDFLYVPFVLLTEFVVEHNVGVVYILNVFRSVILEDC